MISEQQVDLVKTKDFLVGNTYNIPINISFLNIKFIFMNIPQA